MTLADVLGHSISNLNRHKLRTALTLAGVSVGVATLTVLVSLGAGIQKLIEDKLNQSELLNRISVMPTNLAERFGRREAEEGSGPKLTDGTIETLKKLPGVISVYPDLSVPIGAEFEHAVFLAKTEGMPFDAMGPGVLGSLQSGRFWTPEAQGDVVVAPSSELLRLGFKEPREAVGRRMAFVRLDRLNEYAVEEVPAPAFEAGKGEDQDGKEGKAAPRRRYRYTRPASLAVVEAEIIGVYDSEQFGFAGDRFLAPMPLAQRLCHESGFDRFDAFGGPIDEGGYRGLYVKVRTTDDVNPVCDEVEKLGFGVFTVMRVLKVIGVIFKVIEVLLGFFGGIGLLVSFFGIANTMVMAVLERTREIGTLKALGARDRDVRRMFLFEAAGIGVGGGVLGVGFGWALGAILNALASYLLREALTNKAIAVFYVPGWLAAAAVGISTVVAAVAGLYPAWRAAKLDPVEALRRD